MNDRPEVTQQQITRGLRELGVAAGDVVLAHSSLSSLGHVVGGADAAIDALLGAVGPDGTVMVPTQTWDRINAANAVFDVRRTESCTGRICEVLRARPEALRGLHPTHSCAAIGPMRHELMRGHETQVTPCGRKSPYQRLMDCGGKIVFLGVTPAVNTCFHAMEEIAGVPWLFDRWEMLFTVDYEGRRIAVPSRRHSVVMGRAYAAMEPLLVQGGVLVKGRIGAATVRVVDAAGMERVMALKLADDPFLLLAPKVAERERRGFGKWVGERIMWQLRHGGIR